MLLGPTTTQLDTQFYFVLSAVLNSLTSVHLQFIMHLDKELAEIVAKYGSATYAILWGIVFTESAFVIFPFLPGVCECVRVCLPACLPACA